MFELSADMEKKTFPSSWTMMAVLVSASVFLIFRKFNFPFSIDQDTKRIFMACRPLWQILIHRNGDNRQPELPYLILHFFTYFGLSEFWMRLPSDLFCLADVALFYRIALKFFRPALAFAAVVLFLSNPAFVAQGQGVNWVPLLIFLTLLFWKALAAMSRGISSKNFIFLAFIATLLPNASYFGFLVVACGFFYGISLGRKGTRILASLSAGIVAAGPSWFWLWKTWREESSERKLAHAFPHLVWGNLSVLSVFKMELNLFFQGPISLLFVFLFALGILVCIRRPGPNRFWLFLVFAAAAGAFLAPLMRLKDYYFLFALPAVCLMTIEGMRLSMIFARLLLKIRFSVAALSIVPIFLTVAYAFSLSREMFHEPTGKREMPFFVSAIKKVGHSRAVFFAPDNLWSLFVYYSAQNRLNAWNSCQITERYPIECSYEGWRVRGLISRAHFNSDWPTEVESKLHRQLTRGNFWWIEDDVDFADGKITSILRQYCSLAVYGVHYSLFFCSQNKRSRLFFSSDDWSQWLTRLPRRYLFNMAMQYQNWAMYERVEKILRLLIKKSPSDASRHSDLGVCLFLSGHIHQSEKEFKTAISLNAEFWPAYLSLGAVDVKDGRPQEALKAYNYVITHGRKSDSLVKAALEAKKGLLSDP